MRLTDILGMRKVVLSFKCDPWFKRNQWMKFAFAYKGRVARCHKLGINRVYKALQNVRASRDVRKEVASDLWNERLSIASEHCGLPNANVLCEGLGQCNIALNRNMLQILAVYEPRTFAALADIAKQYHTEKGIQLPNPETTSRVVTRGMLNSPITPGNKHLFFNRHAIMLRRESLISSFEDSDDEDSNVVAGRHRRSASVAPSTDQPRFSTSDHMRNAWNQLKFGWTVRYWPQFSKADPLVFLGCWYSPTDGFFTRFPKFVTSSGTFSDFADDFASRLWFSYRDNFPSLCHEPSPHGVISSAQPNGEGDWIIPPGTPCSIDAELGVMCFNHCSVDPTRSCETHRPSLTDSALSSPQPTDSHSSARGSRSTSRSQNGSSTWNTRLRALKRAIQYEPVNQSIPLTVQTSDCGWGCMIRSGQMLLAQALCVHLLGRHWRLFRRGSVSRQSEIHTHRRIIRWFHDSWAPSALFSLHRLLRFTQLPPGSWFGPTTICTALLRAVAAATDDCAELAKLEVYLARDRVIYRGELMDLARGIYKPRDPNRIHYTDHTGHYRASPIEEGQRVAQPLTPSPHDSNNPVILLIPLMLGTQKLIDPGYTSIVTRFLEDPCCVGLIGGRPKHSIYVCGYQGQRLILFDPHFTQPVVDVTSDRFPVKSWHCPVPKLTRISRLDPSCAVGFYARTRGELSDLLDRLPSLFTPLTRSSPASSSLVEVVLGTGKSHSETS